MGATEAHGQVSPIETKAGYRVSMARKIYGDDYFHGRRLGRMQGVSQINIRGVHYGGHPLVEDVEQNSEFTSIEFRRK